MRGVSFAPAVGQLFPAHYTQSGSPIVKFIETYYRWLETILVRENVDQKDVDSVSDDILGRLAATYYAGIDLSGVPDLRLLIKHAGELYDTKGTSRGIKLLLRILLGAESSVYYPGANVFRTSDNTWYAPSTLEVTPAPGNKTSVGTVVRGLRSGATGYIDSMSTVSTPGSGGATVDIDMLVVSGINGTFAVGEQLTTGGFVRGSLTGLDDLVTTWPAEDGFVSVVGGSVPAKGYIRVKSSGVIDTLVIVSSGMRFVDRTVVSLIDSDGRGIANGKVVLTGSGVVEGKWMTDSGMLSGANALFDGYYFQDYSYEVRAPASLDKYVNTLTAVSHVAGTKVFGKPTLHATGSIQATATSSVTTTSS
jgi:hypothetical protein